MAYCLILICVKLNWPPNHDEKFWSRFCKSHTGIPWLSVDANFNFDKQGPSPKHIKLLMLLLSGKEFCYYLHVNIHYSIFLWGYIRIPANIGGISKYK